MLCISIAASSVTVISNSSDAKDCASAATLASKDLLVSERDIKQCSLALVNMELSRRDRAATLVNRAVIFMQLSDFKSAFNDLNKAQTIYPSFGAINVNLGNIFFLGEAYPRALENYNLAIEKSLPELHVAYMNRGLVYKAMNNPLAAIKDFQKALELKPDWELPKEKIAELLSLDQDEDPKE